MPGLREAALAGKPMGQSVSVDLEPADLKTLFKLGQASQQAPSTAGAVPLLDGARHHLKAWKFEKNGRVVVDSPANLCDARGHLGVDLQRTCSYLILHVHAKPGGSGETSAPSTAATLEELVALAGETCTPRGLKVEVVAQSDMSSSEHSYALYVWHGVAADPYVRARVFTKAFELECILRIGLLSQPRVYGAPANLRAHGEDSAWQNEPELADLVRRSGNRLLRAILDGVPQAGQHHSAAGNARTRGSGASRFPRLGMSVCRSLGVSPKTDAWCPTAPASVAPAGPAVSSAAPAPVVHQTAPVVVPRLQLGTALQGLAKRDAGSDDMPTETPASMDVDSTESAEPSESGGRKRGRGPEIARPPSHSTQSSGTPFSAGVPKSARTDLSLPLPSPRGQPDADVSAQACKGTPAGMPGLDLQATREGRHGGRDRDCMRTDAPAMLNLEEINMSEEELIRTYDPENEENNYHLPHHLMKKLQLEQFRPVCSEVIKELLYIGSHQVAANLELLRRNGITHIVNTAADVCTNHFVGEFQYLTYYLKDGNQEDIAILFYKTLKWVDDAMQRGGRVLIHCREGVSRSSTMVIAYLMWRYAKPFEAAHEMIRRVRMICNPNTGFTCQLIVLGKRLGLGGSPAQAPAADRPLIYRVGPYHPNEPFLLLHPVEMSQWSSAPNFDSRFGWVVQRGLNVVLWIGSQVVDAEAAKNAVLEHFDLVHLFEKYKVNLSVIQDDLEPNEFWQHCGLTTRPADHAAFAAPRPSLDADADILAAARGLSARQAVADDLQVTDTSPREDASLDASTSSTASSPDAGAESGDRGLLDERSVQAPASAGPPPKVPLLNLGVPPLALGGLKLSQPPSDAP